MMRVLKLKSIFLTDEELFFQPEHNFSVHFNFTLLFFGEELFPLAAEFRFHLRHLKSVREGMESF